MKTRRSVQPLPRKLAARCFYCGGPGETRDHVPPRGFFLEPLPENLTTIPSCRACNQELGRDEEYLLTAVTYCSFNPVLQGRLQPGGDLHNPNLVKRIGDTRYQQMGMTYVEPEWGRVCRVVQKLVVGLYYRRYGALVPVSSIADVRAWHQIVGPAWAHPQAITERFTRKRWDVVQPHVFEFIFVNDLADSGCVRCLINLYDTICAEAACPRPTRKMKAFPRGRSLFDPEHSGCV